MDRTKENALVVCREALGLKLNETLLIVTNEEQNVFEISLKLAEAAQIIGAKPLRLRKLVPQERIFADGMVVIQPIKTSQIFTEDYVIEALKQVPDIFISLSTKGLGQDRTGLEKGYWRGKKKFNSLLDYLLTIKKTRSFWSPGITKDIWDRCVGIDYQQIQREAEKLSKILNQAKGAHILTHKGSDFYVGLERRKALKDDGDISQPGKGGNLPCGEVYISPQIATSRGRLIIDGAIRYNYTGETVVFDKEPLEVWFENGYLKDIKSDEYRDEFLAGLYWAELEPFRKASEDIEKLLDQGMVNSRKLRKILSKWGGYSQNSRHCGELGIGLLKEASFVSKNMLEIEKIRKTCHIAFGSNYDDDAPALVHNDAIILNPTIKVFLPEGERTILKEGELVI